MLEKPTLNELSRNLLDELPQEVIWIDEAGNIIYANNQFYKRLGYKKEASNQLSVYDVNPTITREGWARYCQSVRKYQTESCK